MGSPGAAARASGKRASACHLHPLDAQALARQDDSREKILGQTVLIHATRSALEVFRAARLEQRQVDGVLRTVKARRK